MKSVFEMNVKRKSFLEGVAYIFVVGWVPCHHSMARSQVADGGSCPDSEGSCECIE
jgi:hypothetical protein